MTGRCCCSTLPGEGRADLLVTAGGASQPAGAPEYQPRLFLNDGHGHFRPARRMAHSRRCPSAPAPACAADFDRDGRLDLFNRRAGLARTLPGCATERAAGEPRGEIRGRHRCRGSDAAPRRHGHIGTLERRGRRRLAGPVADARMGRGEVFPQRRREEVRGLDGEGGLRLGGDGLVAVESRRRTSTAMGAPTTRWGTWG